MARIDYDFATLGRKTTTIIFDVDFEGSGSASSLGDVASLCTLPAGAAIVGIKANVVAALEAGGTGDIDLTVGVSGDMDSLFLTDAAELESVGSVAGVDGVDMLEVISGTSNTEILFGFIDTDGAAGTDALTAGSVRIAVTIAEKMNG